MSTTGQFSSKNPTIKRILKEASELASQPSSDYHAAPLEADLFEWHFTLRGPPAPSPFEGGAYHGRIILPPAYPLKPPSFRFLTPTGRFEVNREICLSISGHHEETWQPAWGIRTALVAIRSFMDTSASGQLGGMEASEEVRKRMAGQSMGWKCPMCAKSNSQIMSEHDEIVKAQGGEEKVELVPEDLRLQYREDLGKSKEAAEVTAKPSQESNPQAPASVSNADQQTPGTARAPRQQLQPEAQIHQDAVPAWIDKAIYGIIAALVFLVLKKFAL